MNDYVDIGHGEKLYKGGLKGFDKESFISFIQGNQEAGRIHKNVDTNKAWRLVEKYTKVAVKKVSKKDKKGK